MQNGGGLSKKNDLPGSVQSGAGFSMVILGIVLPLVMLFRTYTIVLSTGITVVNKDEEISAVFSVVFLDIWELFPYELFMAVCCMNDTRKQENASIYNNVYITLY